MKGVEQGGWKREKVLGDGVFASTESLYYAWESALFLAVCCGR